MSITVQQVIHGTNQECNFPRAIFYTFHFKVGVRAGQWGMGHVDTNQSVGDAGISVENKSSMVYSGVFDIHATL